MAGIDYAGVYRGDIESVSNMQGEEETQAVKDYSLMQNYPNPFNPSTKISFTLPEKSNVTLKVYDMLGKEVRTRLNQEMTSGVHSVEFNAERLSSGLYLARITAGSFTKTIKMNLVK